MDSRFVDFQEPSSWFTFHIRPGEITAICDQMIFLENGKLVKRGDPSELFTTRNVAVFDLK